MTALPTGQHRTCGGEHSKLRPRFVPPVDDATTQHGDRTEGECENQVTSSVGDPLSRRALQGLHRAALRTGLRAAQLV